MKIIITGGLGHIGSAFIREIPLSFEDCEIVIIDNLLTQRYCSLFNLPIKGNYIFDSSNIVTDNLDKLFQGASIVIHLAAITDAAGSFENAQKVENNNFEGTKRIADYCIKFDVKMISLSSTSVYGSSKKLVDESSGEEDLNPQSPYATTKLKEEKYINDLIKGKGLKATIFRFGTIFGISPGMRFHTAVNKFCWQASWGTPLTVWSTAYDQVRPYLYIKDACNALIHVIENDIFLGQTYNVLTLNASVHNVIDEIKKLNMNPKIEMVNSSIMNQLSYEVSPLKFIKTGFVYQGSLPMGIKETISILGRR